MHPVVDNPSHAVAVDESISHDVEALEPSTFLLTLARDPHDVAATAH